MRPTANRLCRFKTEIDTTNQNIFIFDKNIMPNSQIDRECYKYHSIPIRVYCKNQETLHYKKNTYNIYSINVDYSTFQNFHDMYQTSLYIQSYFNILYTNRGHYKLQIKYKIKSFLNHFKR